MKLPAYCYRLFSMIILIFVLVLTIVRARHQDITHDEAWILVHHIVGGPADILKYDTSNHVFFNLLAAASVHLFGLSEFTLRLPSILGAMLYLAAAYYTGKFMFDGSVLFPLTVALLTLNPTITDFMCAARGYGMGVAFLLLGMLFLAHAAESVDSFFESPSCRRWSIAAALACAFSFGSNLTNLVPVFALGVSWSLCVLLASKMLQQSIWRGLEFLAKYFVAPGVLLGLAILWPFLIQIRVSQFDFGHDHRLGSLLDVFNASFLYKWTDDSYNSLGGLPPMPHSWQARVSNVGCLFVVPVLLLVILMEAIRAFRPPSAKTSRARTRLQIFCGASILSVAFVEIMHRWLHTPYPINRTCLYVVPLFTVTVLTILRDVSDWPNFSWLKPVGLFLALLIAADYALALHHTYFRYTEYDRSSRELFQAIQSDAQSRGLASARIGGTWWYQPEIDFYRIMYKASWLQPYDLKDPSHPQFLQAKNSLQPIDYDYFLCTSQDSPDFDGRPVRKLFGDKVTGLTAVAIGW
jgi:hypothetical protein